MARCWRLHAGAEIPCVQHQSDECVGAAQGSRQRVETGGAYGKTDTATLGARCKLSGGPIAIALVVGLLAATLGCVVARGQEPIELGPVRFRSKDGLRAASSVGSVPHEGLSTPTILR